MRRVNLDLLRPTRAHLAERELRMLEHDFVLDVAEADGNARGVLHIVGAYADEVGREGAGGGAQDEAEGVLGGELEAGEFRGRVGERGGDGGEARAVAVDVERAEGRGGKVERGPFERDGGLGDVAELCTRSQ